MKEFLRDRGTEVLFLICGTIIVSIFFICITIGTMNGNRHYYASMNKCIEAGGTWIPNKNVGICLVRGSAFND
jgi:hypothetical protein